MQRALTEEKKPAGSGFAVHAQEKIEAQPGLISQIALQIGGRIERLQQPARAVVETSGGLESIQCFAVTQEDQVSIYWCVHNVVGRIGKLTSIANTSKPTLSSASTKS